MIKRLLAYLFLVLVLGVTYHCARPGNPTGGPKDISPPELVRAEPDNYSIHFDAERIRLYFDEYIKLQDIQNQLIVSPPLKYIPEISPQGGAAKFVEIKIKDTLRENTTYTLNFGQSIVDNNEGNPIPFFSYVFSTGDYIDSLEVSGVVKDAFNREPDELVSVLLYEIDSSYTDSTIYKLPPNYITNAQDSTHFFYLRNLKEGRYALFGLKDDAKNHVFDQLVDKIAFIKDTVELPTDSVYLLSLFREVPDYSISTPSFAASNKIIFGHTGPGDQIRIELLSDLPDSVRTLLAKEAGKDSLNFWFSPTEADSLIFRVVEEASQQIDTFTVKSRKLAADSLQLTASHRGSINFADSFSIQANIPLMEMDSSKFKMTFQDTVPVPLTLQLDSALNKVKVGFLKQPSRNYSLQLLPGAVTDFFGDTNDSITYRLSTKGLADYGNLRMYLQGLQEENIILQLTDEKGVTKREIIAAEPQAFEFNALEPGRYRIRIIYDRNANGKWDTGDYLDKVQPEQVIYYPELIEVRANWELEQTFTLGS